MLSPKIQSGREFVSGSCTLDPKAFILPGVAYCLYQAFHSGEVTKNYCASAPLSPILLLPLVSSMPAFPTPSSSSPIFILDEPGTRGSIRQDHNLESWTRPIASTKASKGRIEGSQSKDLRVATPQDPARPCEHRNVWSEHTGNDMIVRTR